jgi:hypothetical protein
MEERLKKHIDALKNDEDIDKQPRLSIGIFGSPGSGKSSLLKTFVQRVREGKVDGLSGKVYSLPVIQPKLVAKDDHFLYTFLATALKVDRDKHEKGGDPYRNSPILSKLQQSFQEVSGYLQVINEVENPQEDDPLGRSLERLERHESGLLLINKMSDFINELAKLFEGSDQPAVVLLPVDDADMSRDVLVSALDTCDRFLRHPRLIPVFTFTGRLTKELLLVQYEEKLNLSGESDSTEKLKEASTSLLVSENLVIQYLTRLFPVRNRIRMGPASARVLGAKYSTSGNKEGQEVLVLLEAVSRLLFGHAPVPIVPAIRPPLRMVTLRRQIQIVDAMQAAGIERFMKNVEKKQKEEDPDKNESVEKAPILWGQTFDLATWSLLNAHRDVLKEIKINLDDLYSWTPKGLRQVVLDCILHLEREKRRRLIKHWRYHTEDRRSQVISLLAANVFRPRMKKEEPTGDDRSETIRAWEAKEKNEKMTEKDTRFFSIRKGITWFLDLCTGFYLPQILAWNRSDKIYGEELKINRISGIGWDLMSGPIHAIREALKDKKIFSSGMLFLDPEKFAQAIHKDNNKIDTKTKLLIHTWCFYGFEEGKPWAAISLWRGLGLLGQLLKTDLYQEEIEKDKRFPHFENLLRKHFDSAMVLGNLPKGQIKKNENAEQDPNDPRQIIFTKWDEYEDVKDSISDLAKVDLKKRWFDELNKLEERGQGWIYPMDTLREDNVEFSPPTGPGGNKFTPDDKKFHPYIEIWKWEACFTRRLHGENLIGIFFKDLENSYFEKQLSNWTAKDIFDRWLIVLEDYWKDCGAKINLKVDKDGDVKKEIKESIIKNLLKSCPILNDFRESKRTEIPVESLHKFSVFCDSNSEV